MSNFTQIKIWIKLDLQHRIGAAKNIKGFCCRAVLTICHDRAGVSSWQTLLFIARVWWGGPAFTRNHCHRHANQLRWISDKWNQQKTGLELQTLGEQNKKLPKKNRSFCTHVCLLSSYNPDRSPYREREITTILAGMQPRVTSLTSRRLWHRDRAQMWQLDNIAALPYTSVLGTYTLQQRPLYTLYDTFQNQYIWLRLCLHIVWRVALSQYKDQPSGLGADVNWKCRL